jgi:hypothetical protein
MSIYMVYNQNMVKSSYGWSWRTPQISNKNKNGNSFMYLNVFREKFKSCL